MSNGSGDYVIAFSTMHPIPDGGEREQPAGTFVTNNNVSPLLLAVVEATEEAVYNSLFQATTVTGRDAHTVEAPPLERVLEICRKYVVSSLQERLPEISRCG